MGGRTFPETTFPEKVEGACCTVSALLYYSGWVGLPDQETLAIEKLVAYSSQEEGAPHTQKHQVGQQRERRQTRQEPPLGFPQERQGTVSRLGPG